MIHTDVSAPDAERIVALARDMGPRERRIFIDSRCAEDADLRSQVLALLETNHDAPGWPSSHDELADHDADEAWQPSPLIGTRIGVYQLLELLGSGGMGEVYRAARRDGEFEHQVAIKLVRTQLLNDDIRIRLRTERQILANLRHPNIASLYDGGTAPDGSPYLVMEYIRGVPIDLYGDREKLTIEQRVELFCKVCAAVQCAHQNLIVHRDLKPSNILVTDAGEPKLLDFGIAKLLERDITPTDMAVTQYGFRVLTPAHAAPEQVRGEVITTSCDVYVLGVVLYELLCGRRPFTLPANCCLSDIEKLVCRTRAPLPSEMVMQTAELFPVLARDIAQSRHITTHKLARRLRGDLDNIVRMAMRKNPEHRYASATQLSDDLQNWLAGQPVQAASDHLLYRGRKFVRRHALACGLTVTLLVMAATVTTTAWLYSRNLEQQRVLLTAQQQRAEQTASFMLNLFEVIDPTHRHGNELSARSLLDIGMHRLEDSLHLPSSTRASLLTELGKAYGQLGLYAESATTLDKAMQASDRAEANDDRVTVNQLPMLAANQIAQGQLEEAEQTLTRAQKLVQTLPSITDISPNEMIERSRLLYLRGQLAAARGQQSAAETQWRLALAASDAQPSVQVVTILSDLAALLSQQQRYAEAEARYRSALGMSIALQGDHHPQTALLQWHLGELLGRMGNIVDAGTLLRTALTTQRRVLGRTHPVTLESLERYGDFLRIQGQLAQARAMVTEALLTHRHEHGERDLRVADDRVRLGRIHYDAGDYEDAAVEFRAALSLYETADDVNAAASPETMVAALTGLGRSDWRLGRLSQALNVLRHAARLLDQQHGAAQELVSTTHAALGLALLEQGQRLDALPLLQAAQPVLIISEGRQGVQSLEVAAGLQRLQR